MQATSLGSPNPIAMRVASRSLASANFIFYLGGGIDEDASVFVSQQKGLRSRA